MGGDGEGQGRKWAPSPPPGAAYARKLGNPPQNGMSATQAEGLESHVSPGAGGWWAPRNEAPGIGGCRQLEMLCSGPGIAGLVRCCPPGLCSSPCSQPWLSHSSPSPAHTDPLYYFLFSLSWVSRCWPDLSPHHSPLCLACEWHVCLQPATPLSMPGDILSRMLTEQSHPQDSELDTCSDYKAIEVPANYTGPRLSFPLLPGHATALVEAFRLKQVSLGATARRRPKLC